MINHNLANLSNAKELAACWTLPSWHASSRLFEIAIAWKKSGDLDPHDFFARAAQAFGWTLEQFQDNMDDTRLEFLYHYARDYKDVLAAMIEEGETP